MKKSHTVAIILFTTLCSSGCSSVSIAKVPATPTTEIPQISSKPETHQAVLDAMESELNRSKTSLKIDDYSLPYFIAYRLFDVEGVSISGKYGAIQSISPSRTRTAYVEVRVGDYKFDNYANIDTSTYRMSEKSLDPDVTYGTDKKAIRATFWNLTDQEYKRATSEFLSKKGGAIYATDEKKSLASFSKEPPNVDIKPISPFKFDTKKWTHIVEHLSKAFTKNPDISDSSVTVTATHTLRYLVTTEGTKLLGSRTIYAVLLDAETIAPDGMTLTSSKALYARSATNMPSEKELDTLVSEMSHNLTALKNAPTIDPYTGPAILMPEASGVLFHEAVGHRLEGERQRDDEDGQTFKGRIGKKVLPDFLTIYDDPTVPTLGNQELNGSYSYDEEGVKASRANLVDHGVLRAFLKSRTPIEGSLHSNGHGRASGVEKPMARMANLFVVADKTKQMPLADLKKKLIEEVKRQGKPFGLIIGDITGGSTNTSGYGYQAFKGTPEMIYKVTPDGKETLVRGAELVGTPLTSINKIIAASDTMGAFNGYCGAESGWVPVSAVAPALLTTEVELQRNQLSKERPPILPAPWLENHSTEQHPHSTPAKQASQQAPAN